VLVSPGWAAWSEGGWTDWVAQTGKAKNVTYVNTTGHTILVSAAWTVSTSGQQGWRIGSAGTATILMAFCSVSPCSAAVQVPAGWGYRLNVTSGGTFTLTNWMQSELIPPTPPDVSAGGGSSLMSTEMWLAGIWAFMFVAGVLLGRR
jgi:hypothetical protein